MQRGVTATAGPRVDNFRVVDAARLIPKFDASDLENYLHLFERICTINLWPKEHWSAILQTQLSGKALKVFSELSETECANYGKQTSINILRDTAALQSLLRSSAVPEDALIHTGDVRWIRGISGKIIDVPLVQVHLKCDLFDSLVDVCLISSLPDGVDFLLGNDLCSQFTPVDECVVTRSMTHNAQQLSSDVTSEPDDGAVQDVHRLFCQDASQAVQDREFSCESPCDRSSDCDVQSESSVVNLESVMSPQSPDEFIALQQNDETIKHLFDKVECEPFPLNRSYFYMKNGILMRRDVKSNHNVTYDQLVMPQPLCNKLLL